MNRPVESDYTSLTAYTRALEAYCDSLQPEQEPVAWPCLIDSADFSEKTITLVMQCEDYKVSAGTHYLSTTPPQRTWVGLTEEEVDEIYTSVQEEVTEHWDKGGTTMMFPFTLYKANERKLKEKNT